MSKKLKEPKSILRSGKVPEKVISSKKKAHFNVNAVAEELKPMKKKFPGSQTKFPRGKSAKNGRNPLMAIW